MVNNTKLQKQVKAGLITPQEAARRRRQSQVAKVASGSTAVVATAPPPNRKRAVAVRKITREVKLGTGYNWYPASKLTDDEPQAQRLLGSTVLKEDGATLTAPNVEGQKWTLEKITVVVTKTLSAKGGVWEIRAALASDANHVWADVNSQNGRVVRGTHTGGDVKIVLPFRKGDPRSQSDFEDDDIQSLFVLVFAEVASEDANFALTTSVYGTFSYDTGTTTRL